MVKKYEDIEDYIEEVTKDFFNVSQDLIMKI